MASKLYGVNATIIIFVFVLYCIVLVHFFRLIRSKGFSRDLNIGKLNRSLIEIFMVCKLIILFIRNINIQSSLYKISLRFV